MVGIACSYFGQFGRAWNQFVGQSKRQCAFVDEIELQRSRQLIVRECGLFHELVASGFEIRNGNFAFRIRCQSALHHFVVCVKQVEGDASERFLREVVDF